MSINGLGPTNLLLQPNNSSNKASNNFEIINVENNKPEVHVGSLGLGAALAVAYDLCNENITMNNQLTIAPSIYSQTSQVSGLISASTMKSPNNTYGFNNFQSSSVLPLHVHHSHSYLTPIASGFLSPQKSIPKPNTNVYPSASAISLHKMPDYPQVMQSNNCVGTDNYKYNYVGNNNNTIAGTNVNNVICALPVLTSHSTFNGTTPNNYMNGSQMMSNTSHYTLSTESRVGSNMFPVILTENGANYYGSPQMSKLNSTIITTDVTNSISTNVKNATTTSNTNVNVDTYFNSNNSNVLAQTGFNTSETNTKSNSDSPPNPTDESMYELNDEEIREIDNRLYSNEDVMASRQWKYFVETNEWTRATCALMACLFSRDQMANSTVLGRGGSQRARLPMNLVAYVVTTVKRRFNKPAAAIRARMAQKCKDERRFGRSPVPPVTEVIDNGMITGQSPVAAITTKHNPRKVRKRPYSDRSPGKSSALDPSRHSSKNVPDYSLNQFGSGNYSIEDGTSSSATDSNQLPPLNLSPLECSSDLYDIHNPSNANSTGANGGVSSASFFYTYDSSVGLSPSGGATSNNGHSVVPAPLIFHDQSTSEDSLMLYNANSAVDTKNATLMTDSGSLLSSNAVHVPGHNYQSEHIMMSSSSSASSLPASWNASTPMNAENHIASYSLSCV